MDLTLNVVVEGKEKMISCPDEGDIVKALLMIVGKDDSFIILSRSEETYLQTDGTSLEHQEGSLGYHYYSPQCNISVETTANIFLSYARGNDWWKQAIPWQRGFPPGTSLSRNKRS
ncbi:MAG: hypothetical protein ABSG99_07735 [Sedimentisphaerales bacterium]